MEFENPLVAGEHCMTAKEHTVYQAVELLYRKKPDWATFFRETLGVNGIVRTAFPSVKAMAAFEKTDEYAAIQQMLVKLRSANAALPPADEVDQVITVRLPKSMHAALKEEAHGFKTSMNKLCISKLLQIIDQQLIPTDTSAPKPVDDEAPQPIETE
jgi:predicted HicB family RNase H-like nuclease